MSDLTEISLILVYGFFLIAFFFGWFAALAVYVVVVVPILVNILLFAAFIKWG